MSYIIYPQQPDNKLAVIIPAPCELTIEEIAEKDVPKNTPYTIVDSLENIDDEYFDGFIYEDGEAKVDIDRCKNIHLNKFRMARIPILEKLDVEYMKALEVGNTEKTAEIATKKQELRDITKITLPNTLDELKGVWPEILN